MPKVRDDAEGIASSIISGSVPIVRVPATGKVQPPPSETIDSHILAYYYAALTNLICQSCLWPMKQEESNDTLQAIIEASYSDFQTMENWLDTCDPNEIWASPNSRLYKEVREMWRQRVMDWQCCRRKLQQSMDSD